MSGILCNKITFVRIHNESTVVGITTLVKSYVGQGTGDIEL